MAVSYATYERVALEDTDGQWELVCGKLRERPRMTQEHNDVARKLARQLMPQLPDDTHVSMNAPSLRVGGGTYVVPDVAVLPPEVRATIAPRPHLETYEVALPFIAEVWSPSTGSYDVETKFPEYRARGDLENLAHPPTRPHYHSLAQAAGRFVLGDHLSRGRSRGRVTFRRSHRHGSAICLTPWAPPAGTGTPASSRCAR